ncbi:AMIN-like domain-containing (lipo)protein [Streptomyces sp. MH13]|uniref:AMIN-like domain-containing (lipo)protein n=1 Tax=Streptomyces sp. MH13 TaxID=3417651 RepID=UPI003CF17255
MRRSRTAWVTVVLAGAALGTATVAADAAPGTDARSTVRDTAHTTACPTGWGSLAKTRAAGTTAPVKDVRTARHACFDRMVVDVPGASADRIGYVVRYVDRVHQDGSGRPIAVDGGAVLEVRIAAPGYRPETGAATYPGRADRPLPDVDLTGYRAFRDTRFAGSFEGETQIGLGVRTRLPFRVLALDGRLVVDVAHSWSGTR